MNAPLAHKKSEAKKINTCCAVWPKHSAQMHSRTRLTNSSATLKSDFDKGSYIYLSSRQHTHV